MSINLSAIQLRNPDVVQKYIEIGNKYEVNMEDLQLEITENALIENEELALGILTNN